MAVSELCKELQEKSAVISATDARAFFSATETAKTKEPGRSGTFSLSYGDERLENYH